MEGKKGEPKKVSMTNTKQEMMDAYHAVLKQIQEKQEAELRPEKKVEEKREKEVVQVAQALSSDGAVKAIASLRTDIGKMLGEIGDRLEEEIGRFNKIQEAIHFKEKELEDLYGIEKAAASLAALIESQNKKQEDFEARMAAEKERLSREIDDIRAHWEEEKRVRDAETKDWEGAEKKRRERQREEFDYGFKREQKMAIEALGDEKARLEKDIAAKKIELEAGLSTREKAVGEKEAELAELQKRVSGIPKEIEAAVSKAVKDATDRLSQEAKAREQLMQSEFDGERNVLKTRIESLEKAVKEYNDQTAKLSQQLEKAYQKIEDVAVKTIEGASNAQSLTQLQQFLSEQMRKQTQER